MQDLPDINRQLSSKTLLDAFKMQLIKDFEQSNYPTSFIDELEPDYNKMLASIAFELQRNETKSDSGIMQLLYRIDISEAQLKKALHTHIGVSYNNVLAELIIKRILQKVVIKQYYKNTNGPH
ncbi:MAG: hypothetical protein V4613_05395 [Bacteroidota bacterium]